MPNVRVRLVHAAAWAFLYQLFGTSPLGYHVCNAILLISMALLLFALLWELGQPLLIAVSVPAVYLLLPHYSTDRFWLATIQADISIASYFLSFYAALRSLRAGWIWLVVCVLSTSACVLSYEVAVPLFMLNVALVLWRGQWNNRARLTAVLIGSAVIACFLFKTAVN